MNKTSHRNSQEYKAYRREYSKNYYKTKYAAKQYELVRKRKLELTRWLKELKSTLKCHRCSESDPCCIDFHHNGDEKKEFNIGKSIERGFSKKRILSEIEKCTPLCSNCHRKLHDGQFSLLRQKVLDAGLEPATSSM